MHHTMTIEVTDGGVWVDGAQLPLPGGVVDVDAARAAALQVVVDAAREGGRPVNVTALDPDGPVWQLHVQPDGTVRDGHVRDELHDDPAGHRIPAQWRARLAEIDTAVIGGRPRAAVVLAHQLVDDITADSGDRHPWALQALEVYAQVLLVSGDAAAAVGQYIAAAQRWAEIGDPADSYWRAACRAFEAWRACADVATAVWSGERLVDLLRLPAAGDRSLPAVRTVVDRLDGLYTHVG
ncbi:hypothetical protein RVR_P240 (plasmid) [Actinacidiphila reveromycinica]|uniref:Uncharacterized protein n=1 Tax=Actinacidiphila reveromycinica TaxID=659352 RepID=A0A7R6QIJ4_9ACTN|nr:hypothetical protein [Streptomyces sp. SN-593]BBG20783.1 hypothetical protein RVR_P240 [Streptomyces sp. SN-593]